MIAPKPDKPGEGRRAGGRPAHRPRQRPRPDAGRPARQQVFQHADGEAPSRRHQIGPHQAPEIDRHQREQRRRHQAAENRDRHIGDERADQTPQKTERCREDVPQSKSPTRSCMASRGLVPPSAGAGGCAGACAGGWSGCRLRRDRRRAWPAVTAACGVARTAAERRRRRGRRRPAAVTGRSFGDGAGGCSGGSLKFEDFAHPRSCAASARSATRKPLPSPTTVPIGKPGGSKPPSPEVTTWSPSFNCAPVRDDVRASARRCCRRP